MPSRAPRACGRCGRTDCKVHVRKAWSHKPGRASRQARGYGRLARPVACARGLGQHETWDSLRACVLARDSHACAYCPATAATADHRTPKAQGGTNDEANLVACCWPCQKSKAGREGNAGRVGVTRRP